MKHTIIHACTVGPTISEEQFIHEHFFLYLVAGSMLAYDGSWLMEKRLREAIFKKQRREKAF